MKVQSICEEDAMKNSWSRKAFIGVVIAMTGMGLPGFALAEDSAGGKTARDHARGRFAVGTQRNDQAG